jgi:hypothetical protein
MSRRAVLLHSSHRDAFLGDDVDMVFYDQPADVDELTHVRDAHLWSPHGARIDRLPEIVAAMAGLRKLSIGPGDVSSDVVTRLREGDLPEGLRELSILTGRRPVTWPDVRLPNLNALMAEGPLRFSVDSFPELRSLTIYPQRSFDDVRRALALPLEELNLLNVPIDERVFALLEPVGLRRLGLHGGRTLKGLTGIGVLGQLESLRLKNLTSLGDISELATLQRLENLDIQYCKSITGIAAINELAVLRRLILVGCGKIGLSEIEEKVSTLDTVIGATS